MKKRICIDDEFIHQSIALDKIVSFVTLESPYIDILIDKQVIINVYNNLKDSNDPIMHGEEDYDFTISPQNRDIFVEFCK